MEIRFICLRVIFYRGSGENANFGCALLLRKSKDLMQRGRRKGGRKAEKAICVHRRDVESVEKGKRDPSLRSDDDARIKDGAATSAPTLSSIRQEVA
jgi:hypothetical protein